MALHVYHPSRCQSESKQPYGNLHHIVTDKEPVLISMCIQYVKCSLFILIDVICYCLHTKSVIMKFNSDIYISESLYSNDPEF